MGFACPVCDVPQADGEHLAHHLAITALTHGDDHEAWLDEHVEGWASSSPADLASVVTDHAERVEHETVFEDTTGDERANADFEERMARDLGTGGGHGTPGGRDARGGHGGPGSGAGRVDERTAEVLEEARDLTERMYEGDARSDDERGSDDAAADERREAADAGVDGADTGDDVTARDGSDDSTAGDETTAETDTDE